MLYNNDLWGMPSFLHNGVDSKLLMQIYLSKDNQSLSLCLFGVGKILKNGCYSQYILLRSQEKGKLSPLPRNMIPQVMEQLRAFTDAGTLAEILSEIYEPRMFPGKGFQYVSLSPRLRCEICNPEAFPHCPSVYGRIGETKFPIQTLTLYCLNGLDHRVCFETNVSNIPTYSL